MAEIQVKQRNRKGDSRGMNPASRANLRPCLNLNGRPPKAECITSLLRDLLMGNPTKIKAKWLQLPGGPTGAMVVAMALFAKMGKGDIPAIKEGLDRVEGRALDHVDITSKGESINDGADLRAFIANRIASISARGGTPGDTVQPN